jgi:hypothetical protein
LSLYGFDVDVWTSGVVGREPGGERERGEYIWDESITVFR